MSEGSIQKLLFLDYSNDVVVPNVYWNNCRFEMDIARVTKANYLYEYEIKTSVADFKNEFKKSKKRKHNMYKRSGPSSRYIPNYFTVVTSCDDITKDMVASLNPKYGLMHTAKDRRYKTNVYLKTAVKPKKLRPEPHDIDFRKLTRKLSFKLFNNVERFK